MLVDKNLNEMLWAVTFFLTDRADNVSTTWPLTGKCQKSSLPGFLTWQNILSSGQESAHNLITLAHQSEIKQYYVNVIFILRANGIFNIKVVYIHCGNLSLLWFDGNYY